MIDQFIIKLRLVRHLRTPEYNELFGGDPTWVTESIGGMGIDGRHAGHQKLLPLSAYPDQPRHRAGAEPDRLVELSICPRRSSATAPKISIETDSIQYENDDVMRPIYGDDYAIACCVSAMQVGKQMQFFGARCNLAKCLLYAINGGVDEKNGKLVVPGIEPITDEVSGLRQGAEQTIDKVLDYAGEALCRHRSTSSTICTINTPTKPARWRCTIPMWSA